MVSSIGQPHKKEFTYVCTVERYECHGKASKKQHAKQIAAMAMIELLESKQSEIAATKSSISMKIEELPPIEEVVAQYRKLRSKSASTVKGNLRDRHNFFLNLPDANQKKAKEILNRTRSTDAKYVVHEVMKALNLKYEVKRINGNKSIFTLVNSPYDCTCTAKSDEIFTNVIDYLKTMLNVHHALSDVTNCTL